MHYHGITTVRRPPEFQAPTAHGVGKATNHVPRLHSQSVDCFGQRHRAVDGTHLATFVLLGTLSERPKGCSSPRATSQSP